MIRTLLFARVGDLVLLRVQTQVFWDGCGVPVHFRFRRRGRTENTQAYFEEPCQPHRIGIHASEGFPLCSVIDVKRCGCLVERVFPHSSCERYLGLPLPPIFLQTLLFSPFSFRLFFSAILRSFTLALLRVGCFGSFHCLCVRHFAFVFRIKRL